MLFSYMALSIKLEKALRSDTESVYVPSELQTSLQERKIDVSVWPMYIMDYIEKSVMP